MYGIVTLLDAKTTTRVEVIWTEFQAYFGVQGVSQTPIPHVSYHVAAGYDLDALDDALPWLSTQLATFTTQTNGLGVFTGRDPVLYIPVRLEPELASLQKRIWNTAMDVADETNTLYSPENWVPHITLAHKDMTITQIADAVRLLSSRTFAWTLEITNLAIIDATGDKAEVIRQYPFKGR